MLKQECSDESFDIVRVLYNNNYCCFLMMMMIDCLRTNKVKKKYWWWDNAMCHIRLGLGYCLIAKG